MNDGCIGDGICVFSAVRCCLSFVMVAETTEFALPARMRRVFFILMVAEMAEYACSAGFVCVFCFVMVAEMAELWLQEWRNLRFQRASVMFISFVMAVERAESAFSARMRVCFCILMVAEMTEYAFSMRFGRVCTAS